MFDCTIRLNECENDTDQIGGGGIYCEDFVLDFDDLIINDNISAYDGGGIFVLNESIEAPVAEFDNLLIYGNNITSHGGGICIDNTSGSVMTINKCTIANNIGDSYWGGVYVRENEVIVINSIIYRNSDSIGEPQYYQPDDELTDYCCIETTSVYPGTGNINSAPQFVDSVNDVYTLEYYSPCIDTGDDDNDYDDPDGSLCDMGSEYHEQDIYSWETGGSPLQYIWYSFPRLPLDHTVYTANEGDDIPVDEVWETWNAIPDGLTAWYGNEITEHESGDYDEGEWEWDYDEDIYSIRGYKLDKDDAGTCLMFSRGLLCEDDTELSTTMNTTDWLGYFLPSSQLVLDAFPSVVQDVAIKIWTQNWCISRANPNDPWSGSPALCKLNYKDCVLITTVNRSYDFEWETPGRDDEPEYRPRADHFTFSDDIEYFPIYVDFATNDLPQEVAVYVNDVCRGAQVVEDTITQICAYILEEEQGQEIEFAFWYDDRSAVERKSSYLVYNQAKEEYESRNLITGMPGIHYEVSFEGVYEETPPATYNLNCYPNPFNPELTVSFSLEEIQEVKLEVYNLKGQKVRTLVNETFRPDTYNIVWSGNDNSGSKVSSGVYYIRLQVGDEIENDKVILMK